MSQEDVATLRGAFAAFARGDIDAVEATLDPQVVWEGVGELVPGGGRYTGAEEVVREVFGTIAEAYEVFRAEPQEFIDAGERVVVLGTFMVRPEGATEPSSA